MTRGLRYAVDASVLIEVLAGSDRVRGFVEELYNGEALVSRLSLTEAFYVACRLWGRDVAEDRLLLLLESRVFEIVEDERVWVYAADCKCRFPIALGDCFTLATARMYAATPVFLRPEREILRVKRDIEEWLGGKIRFVLEG